MPLSLSEGVESIKRGERTTTLVRAVLLRGDDGGVDHRLQSLFSQEEGRAACGEVRLSLLVLGWVDGPGVYDPGLGSLRDVHGVGLVCGAVARALEGAVSGCALPDGGVRVRGGFAVRLMAGVGEAPFAEAGTCKNNCIGDNFRNGVEKITAKVEIYSEIVASSVQIKFAKSKLKLVKCNNKQSCHAKFKSGRYAFS